jgi:hypothetical protein
MVGHLGQTQVVSDHVQTRILSAQGGIHVPKQT